uniref:putative ABC transporter permease n=1 Tax=Methanobrevibacter woesei TaxID=190976 RepID=UPI00255BBDD8
YCYFTMGILESRKGFIWGPFCPVYGVCGAILIYILDKMNLKSIIKLFRKFDTFEIEKSM